MIDKVGTWLLDNRRELMSYGLVFGGAIVGWAAFTLLF